MTDVPSLASPALDALPLQVAVLDDSGEIVSTNSAWRAFGRENDLGDGSGCVGTNYLSASDVDDEQATPASDGIRAVLAGERERYTLEYPCHAPDEKRWFLMHAAPFEDGGRQYVVVAHQDITDRKLAERDLERKNDRLVELASVLSHDLRNPLNVATGHLELLVESVDSEHLTAARSALDRIETLIHTSLSLVRLEGSSADARTLDLGTAARDAWATVATADATLTVQEDATISADPDLLAQALENLFRNAVEHGSASPRSQAHEDAVEHAGPGVSVRVGPTDAGFFVADDGPGVPESERESVFGLGHSTDDDGTGIGLATVKRVADAHGWSVAVVEGADGGARFEFET